MIRLVRFLECIIKRHSFLCLFLFLLSSCVSPKSSIEEYNLADVALKAAKDSDARRHEPKLYARARRSMKWAEKAYRERDYDKAVKYFRQSRRYSEKAEKDSRLKIFNQGEMVP